MNPMHLETIFCDDIRREEGGKLSFMGVYQSYLFVQKLPVTLPKLCCAVKLIIPSSIASPKVAINIYCNDELLQDIQVEPATLEAPSEETPPVENLSDYCKVLNFNLVFTSMPFVERSTIRVRAKVDEEELSGLALIVSESPA